MNPPLSLPLLLPLLAVVLLVGLALSWRSTRGLPPSRRALLLTLRGVTLCGLGLLLLNFGRWVKPTDTVQRPWIILADTSASMARPSAGSTRYGSARDLAERAVQEVKAAGLPVRIQSFDETLHPAVETLPNSAAGKGSKILRAVESVFQETSAAGESPAGILVSAMAGKPNHPATGAMEALSLRARARENSRPHRGNRERRTCGRPHPSDRTPDDPCFRWPTAARPGDR